MYVKPPLRRSLGWLRKNIGIVLRDGPDAITVHVGEQVTSPATTTTTSLLLFLSSSAPLHTTDECTPDCYCWHAVDIRLFACLLLGEARHP